ncbi:MAG: hypothetical protein KAW12_14585 [Candidatus Aminicenantes bacterium]|nr:hypothetical protein [Candidatus Aminicenantes bacterium]
MQQVIYNSQKEQLENLKKAISLGKRFSLLIAAFNDVKYRDRLIGEIDRVFGESITLEIRKKSFPGFAAFENHIGSLSKRFPVIHIVNNGERFYKDTWPVFFKGLNYHRGKIAGENRVSIILWMLPEDVKDFALNAADMWAWRSGVFNFELPEQQFDTVIEDRVKGKKDGVEERKRIRIDEILNYLKDNPVLEDDLKALLYHELGELYYTLDSYKEAQEYILKSLDLYRKKGTAQKKESLYNLLESIRFYSS